MNTGFQRTMGWKAETDEWNSIRDEFVTSGNVVTAYQISLEQRKRMLARGQRPMTYDEIVADISVQDTQPPGST